MRPRRPCSVLLSRPQWYMQPWTSTDGLPCPGHEEAGIEEVHALQLRDHVGISLSQPWGSSSNSTSLSPGCPSPARPFLGRLRCLDLAWPAPGCAPSSPLFQQHVKHEIGLSWARDWTLAMPLPLGGPGQLCHSPAHSFTHLFPQTSVLGPERSKTQARDAMHTCAGCILHKDTSQGNKCSAHQTPTPWGIWGCVP